MKIPTVHLSSPARFFHIAFLLCVAVSTSFAGKRAEIEEGSTYEKTLHELVDSVEKEGILKNP